MSEYIIDMGNSSYQSTSGLLCADVSQLREEIVRCRDCKHFKAETKKHPALCRLWLPRNLSRQYGIEPDGFCAWGERRWTTCKCGEEIELGGREDAVCPSCGRTVRE